VISAHRYSAISGFRQFQGQFFTDDAVILLPHDGWSVDQNAPALPGRPIPVLDIHTGVKDRPGKGLAHRESKRHTHPFTRSEVCQE
jgi:hypothetical protein